MPGKFIFVSGLSGAGKTTIVRAVLDVRDDFQTVVTYVTRPMRDGEQDATEYVFVNDDEYESIRSSSTNWDETIYAGYKYGADGEKYRQLLHDGVNIIVAVAPDMNIIHGMAAKYGVDPVTIWIDTDELIARGRIEGDADRSNRDETSAIRDKFDHVFIPKGDIGQDSKALLQIIESILRPSK